MGATFKFKGPAPKCAKCGLREANSHSPGAECANCIAVRYGREKRAAKSSQPPFGKGGQGGISLGTADRAMLDEALKIADMLKKADRKTYRDIFAIVHASANRKIPPRTVLEAIKALKREHDYGHKPADLWKYWAGTVRRIRERSEAQQHREGKGPSLLGEIMNRAQARAK